MQFCLLETPRSHREGKANWFATFAIVTMIVGAALFFRWNDDEDSSSVALLRTRKLVEQKVESLRVYNQTVGDEEIISFLSEYTAQRVTAEALAELDDGVVQIVLPILWRESQRASSGSYVSHRAMVKITQERFPRQLLANGDIAVFPDDHQLRLIVAEAPQDYFRDCGRHWQWIGDFIDQLGEDELRKMKELDVYAAEELSELLSVLGVAIVRWSSLRKPDSTSPIGGLAIRETIHRITSGRHRAANSISRDHLSQTNDAKVAYSELAKRQIIESLPVPMFREVSNRLRLDFIHRPNDQLSLRRIYLEVPLGLAGGGVSAADFDSDSWTDLYFAGGQGGRLYRNVSGERFEDVTARSGLRLDGETRAGYFIDYDNDGDDDLFFTCVWHPNRLFANDGTGHFSDVSQSVGLRKERLVSHGAVWFDMDNDGLLDLYVANFGTWTEGAVPTLGRINSNGGPNRLYRHVVVNGQHRFQEASAQLGVDDRGWTHCVGAWDFDQDGFSDLFSLNDFGASLVYRNVGGKRFEEVSRSLRLDTLYNAMNFTLMDLFHNGHMSVYISQIMKLTHRQRYRKPTEGTAVVFSPENTENLRTLVANRLYGRTKEGIYRDLHDERIEPAELGWAWDASAMDYENDGDLDLLVLNGTESRVPGDRRTKSQAHIDGRMFLLRHAEQKNVFYMSKSGYFYDVSAHCSLAYQGNSRSSTFFDFDRDGDLDVAINNYNGPAKVFENVQESGNNWLRLILRGTNSSRTPIGAIVTIHFGDRVFFDQVVSGSGFLGQNPNQLHFGIGKVRRIDGVSIKWPSGKFQTLEGLEVNQRHVIREPDKKETVRKNEVSHSP